MPWSMLNHPPARPPGLGALPTCSTGRCAACSARPPMAPSLLGPCAAAAAHPGSSSQLSWLLLPPPLPRCRSSEERWLPPLIMPDAADPPGLPQYQMAPGSLPRLSKLLRADGGRLSLGPPRPVAPSAVGGPAAGAMPPIGNGALAGCTQLPGAAPAAGCTEWAGPPSSAARRNMRLPFVPLLALLGCSAFLAAGCAARCASRAACRALGAWEGSGAAAGDAAGVPGGRWLCAGCGEHVGSRK